MFEWKKEKIQTRIKELKNSEFSTKKSLEGLEGSVLIFRFKIVKSGESVDQFGCRGCTPKNASSHLYATDGCSVADSRGSSSGVFNQQTLITSFLE